MTDANGAPRRVSMAYILGFSDKPYKEVKPPAPPPPPQPRKSGQPANIMSTPGRIVEWTASDGRKGRLTGTGKPRLTAASLAKVPSEQRPAKELPGAKSASKKPASAKPAVDGDNPWGGNGWDATNAKSGSKKSGSKKASSNNGNTWGAQEFGNDAGNPIANTWDTTPDATGGNDKDEKKDDPADAWNTTTAPEINTAQEDDSKKDGESDAWTKEQDEKLLQMKTVESKSWAEVLQEISGKTKKSCQDRLKELKPDGWTANEVEKGGGGKKGKKGKHANQNDGNTKKDDKKKEEKKEEETGDDGGIFGATFGEDTGNSKDESGDKNNSGDKAPDAWGGTATWDFAGGDAPGTGTNAWETQVEWGTGATTGGGDGANDAAASWDNTGGNNWDMGAKNNQNQNNKKGGGARDTKASAQKAPSNKVPPRAPPQPNANNGDSNNNNNTRSVAARPLELEVKPDDTFSADDLRLVARILQQDCSMVWNRVSWRFRDKTGRTLHPDEFEKKITGCLEGKGSDNGERRR